MNVVIFLNAKSKLNKAYKRFLKEKKRQEILPNNARTFMSSTLLIMYYAIYIDKFEV